MRLAKKFLWAGFFFLPLLFMNAGNAFGVVMDDYTPEVTARVVRISFIRGDVQVRRTGENGEKQEWESAVLNLPIVEGDEISTGANTVVEIQLDSYNHVRLSENAYLKFTTLRDEGIAVSLPQGTMSLRVLNFDKNKSYFEIDAPSTTLSVEKAGMFRIDAGDTKNSEIRVSATEDGEAKVYTQSAGFTLRNGRTAQIFIEGNYAGDYETSNVARITDEFDEWVLQRDAIVAKRLNEAFYDKYYDRDIYGAEDLNEYGEWIYSKKYGYVWKPYPSSVSSYGNWSPYRYGHWRWVPVFGWTWVNDEPWGWATYHHGRWVWDNGYWSWSPYGNYRWRRSWWQPAMISITTWNGRVIWFPLGYEDDYCDYNSGYRRRRNRRDRDVTIINNNTTVIVNPAPNPTNPTPTNPTPTSAEINEQRRLNSKTPTFQRIPANGVVSVKSEEFGKRTRGYETPTIENAKKILSKPIDNQSPPLLPEYKDVKGTISKEILIENPRLDKNQEVRVKTGATERETGKSLDQKLEKERIFGNRQPKIIQEIKTDNSTKNDTNEPRKTGAVDRRPAIRPEKNTNQSPDFNPQTNYPTRTTGGGGKSDEERKNEQKTTRQKPRDDEQTPPIIKPQPKDDEPRRTPPIINPQREEKRQEQPKPQPKPEQPRPQPKPEQPKPQPKPEQPKNEPKKEDKPSQPKPMERKTDKDSRK